MGGRRRSPNTWLKQIKGFFQRTGTDWERGSHQEDALTRVATIWLRLQFVVSQYLTYLMSLPTPNEGYLPKNNPVGGVVKRKPKNVTEHQHLAHEDQLGDVFHGNLLE